MIFILSLIYPYYIAELKYSYHHQKEVYSTIQYIVSYELDVDYYLLFEMDSDQNELFVSQMIYAIINLIYYLNLLHLNKLMEKIYSYALLPIFHAVYTQISNQSNY
jgi:hypothetical protein